LLAGLRALHGEEELREDDTLQDPDDRVDSDDSGPGLSFTLEESHVAEIYALPAAKAEQPSGRYPPALDQSNAPQSPPIVPAAAAGASCTARFTRSRGAPYDASKGSRLYEVRAALGAPVASGDGSSARAQADD
jgi:hypothetical protein